jgi:serine/threonine-protein phosphatase 5
MSSNEDKQTATRHISPADPPSPPPTDKHFQAAVDKYSEAVELRPDCAVYYANRAFAHIKLEEYGSAVADATSAIQADQQYAKVRPATGRVLQPAAPD